MKVEQRHIWKDCEELADDARYTPQYADLYRRRKETIERVFADVEEKHTMRYSLAFSLVYLPRLNRSFWHRRR